MKLDIVENITEHDFVNNYIAKNTPVIVRGIPYQAQQWTPDALKSSIGDLDAQIYGSLFDLEDIQCASDYIDEYFGKGSEPLSKDVPYIRWYNQLKDIDFAWGDTAFDALAPHWRKPDCIPANSLIVPPVRSDQTHSPVSGQFPYRGILLAAKGARTRLHRDPFCSDAVVSQFYGYKEAALYHPSRTAELTVKTDSSSFGGFIDVRADDPANLSHQPDFQGTVEAGDMIFIPHGWLHDVIAMDDSVSVTWNFVHEKGATEFREYLNDSPENDSEFEVLQYFYKLAGMPDMSAAQISASF